MKKKLKYIFLILVILIVILYQIPSPKADFFELYGKTDTVSETLKEFQARKTSEIEIDETKWKYYAGGNGEKTILFLHGMGGSYDLWFLQIAALESKYKVITYTLPSDIDNLADAEKGISVILEKENVDKFYTVGTSMGGYISQYLMTKMPNRIEKMILGNTFAPNDILIKDSKTKSKIIPWLPRILLYKIRTKKLNTELLPAGKNNEILTAFLPSLEFSKKGFMGRYWVVVDKFNVDNDNYEINRIPKLIIESDNDPLLKKEVREELKTTYKNASLKVYIDEGHFPYINAYEDYNNQIITFFETENEQTKIENTILDNYFEGRKNADIEKLKAVFSESATLYTRKENKVLKITLEEYLNRVLQDGNQKVKTSILEIKVKGIIAYCQTKFDYDNKTYLDYLTLIKEDREWKIVSKTFMKLK